ncbi:hypothetical protein M8C21_033881, partial [Ambrosia artemisiifolia]
TSSSFIHPNLPANHDLRSAAIHPPHLTIIKERERKGGTRWRPSILWRVEGLIVHTRQNGSGGEVRRGVDATIGVHYFTARRPSSNKSTINSQSICYTTVTP